MGNIDELLSKLNPEQIKPVLDTEGAVLVIAGAGSGKTRVLTSRIAYLVAEKNVSPSRILAITFTNKAADEMKERLSKLIGDSVSEMWVSTIHSMCVRILRRDIDKIGLDKNFTIYDETDKDKVLKRVFEKLGLDADKLLKSAKNLISTAKNDCISASEFKSAYPDLKFVEEFSKVYGEYERELERSNSLDFDDLLYKTYVLFSSYPEVADYYSNKFEYVHIDEFQDTNKVQFILAQRLSFSHGNIFVVGDDDQSIYGWRGAKIENILSFDDIYRGAKVYKLERNYRSTKKILDLANCIIANNSGRREKKLWTDNGDGAKIETFTATDENNEASFIAFQIKGLLDRGYNYSDFAVFMRVNALSRAFEQEFTKYGIPYKVYGGFRFFERKEIKDVLSYLKVVNNHYDDESFLRAVSSPKRGIGEKTLQELREFSAGVGMCIYDGIDRIEQTSISSGAKTKLFNFKQLLESFKAYSDTHSVVDTISYVLETTSFLEQFEEKSEENTSRLYNINELKNTAELFVRDNPDTTLADFLNSVTLSSDTDEITDGEFVTLATIHAVKGLEFKCVFVAGLDEKILPISRSVGDEDEMEEERRLMYVAITRARERLYLTRATSRYMYGSREYMTQSRFLREGQPVLNPNFKIETQRENTYYKTREKGGDERDTDTFQAGYNSSYAKTFLSANKPKINSTANAGSYKTGTTVKHAKFGEGTVISVSGEGENTVCDVAFKGIGVKKLAVKYAPMEIING